MAWIEVHQSLPSHRKTLEAAALLDIEPEPLVGHLVCFWLWSLDNAPDGVVVAPPRVICRAAGWRGDPDTFVDVLRMVGFLEETDAGTVIHGWDDYAGKLIDRRAANAERMRNARAQHAPSFNKTPDDARAPHVSRTLHARVELPDPTQPNRTGNPLTGVAPAPDPPLKNPKVTIHEPPEPIPKAKGQSLAPLFDAFKALGLSPPIVTGAEAKNASELLRHYSADELAQCWQDHASGDYGDDFSRRDLSFSYLVTRQRVANWQNWKQHATTRGQPAAVRGGVHRQNGAGAAGVDRFAALRGLGKAPPAAQRSEDDGGQVPRGAQSG